MENSPPPPLLFALFTRTAVLTFTTTSCPHGDQISALKSSREWKSSRFRGPDKLSDVSPFWTSPWTAVIEGYERSWVKQEVRTYSRKN
jgi:hypothetical protein